MVEREKETQKRGRKKKRKKSPPKRSFHAITTGPKMQIKVNPLQPERVQSETFSRVALAPEPDSSEPVPTIHYGLPETILQAAAQLVKRLLRVNIETSVFIALLLVVSPGIVFVVMTSISSTDDLSSGSSEEAIADLRSKIVAIQDALDNMELPEEQQAVISMALMQKDITTLQGQYETLRTDMRTLGSRALGILATMAVTMGVAVIGLLFTLLRKSKEAQRILTP
ncbi:MAG: hypothetical protein O7D91_18635 [Planctomycetota bacterium]|nr:hypothetical protein [Planctomycetota bacterium]